MQTAGKKQARKQTKKQEDQKSEEQARIPRNLATSITIPAPKVRAKNERVRESSQSRHNSRYSQELLLFLFSTDASHREEEIQIVLQPEEARTKMRLHEQQVVTGVFF
jgi:hypothetical protein